jgi:hypothetical protein
MKTVAGILNLLHAVFMYPEISRRVFDEIQSVTHGERLPEIADRAYLPYTEAFFREAIRIRTFMPLGKSTTQWLRYFILIYLHTLAIPHVSTEDEIVRGYLIPKGSLIHQNHLYVLRCSCMHLLKHFLQSHVYGPQGVGRPRRF